MIKVGIYGATGYMGSEALRILLQHPQAEVVWATSRGGDEVINYHKNFSFPLGKHHLLCYE